MGSTTKVGSGPILMPGLYVSSPMNEMDGKAEDSRVETIFSTPWSVSVTMSTAEKKECQWEVVTRAGAHRCFREAGVQLSLVPVSIS